MSNILFDQFREDLLNGNIDLVSDDIRAILIDAADWTPNASTDRDLADVPGAAQVATGSALTGKTVGTDGTFDAADVTWASVTGDQSEGMLLYKHTGVPATSTLIAYFDTGVTGLPITPDGGDITVRFDASGILRI